MASRRFEGGAPPSSMGGCKFGTLLLGLRYCKTFICWSSRSRLQGWASLNSHHGLLLLVISFYLDRCWSVSIFCWYQEYCHFSPHALFDRVSLYFQSIAFAKEAFCKRECGANQLIRPGKLAHCSLWRELAVYPFHKTSIGRKCSAPQSFQGRTLSKFSQFW